MTTICMGIRENKAARVLSVCRRSFTSACGARCAEPSDRELDHSLPWWPAWRLTERCLPASVAKPMEVK